VKILFSSDERSLVESREGDYVKEFDSHKNGLNLTKHGAGYGHCDHKFTTLGYKFSEESKKKMSESAKTRAASEEPGLRRKISADNWAKAEYREKQSGKRAGKRLCPPKLSDETVSKLREDFSNALPELVPEVFKMNEYRKSRGYFLTSPERLYATRVCEIYGVSNTCINSILTNKTRTTCLPAIYKS
jgi:hypothetical protein